MKKQFETNSTIGFGHRLKCPKSNRGCSVIMAIDWTKIYKNYKGLWVALKNDEQTVIASGKTPKEVLNTSREKGFRHPILHRVPTEVLPYVGSAWL